MGEGTDAPGGSIFPVVRMNALPGPKYTTDTLLQAQSALMEGQKVRAPWEGRRLITEVLYDIWQLCPAVQLLGDLGSVTVLL